MNWHAIGAIGQTLGSLAVLVTIGLLAVQVHDSEVETKRSIAQSRVERSMAYMSLATNERLVGIHVKVNAALSGDRRKSPFFEAARQQVGLSTDAHTRYMWSNSLDGPILPKPPFTLTNCSRGTEHNSSATFVSL